MFRPVVLLSYVTVSSMLYMTSLSAAASTVITIALCPAGEQPDQSTGDGSADQVYFAADGSRQRLSISQDANISPSCSTVALQVDGGILWSAPATPEQLSSAVRQIGLLGDFATDNPAVTEVIVIADISPGPAPDTDTSPSTETSPSALDSSVLYQRVQPLRQGAWLWSPQLWQQSPESIWRVQAQQQLTEIYISIPVEGDGEIADREMLTQFVTEAGDRGLDVWVVIGDPRDVLPASLAALEARINAFMLYNQNTPVQARLSGVQLDIEPYLLPGFSRAQAYWRDRYVSVITHVHGMLDGRLPLELVMPAWWGSHQAWGIRLFEQLPVDNTRLSIMNYHTSIDRLRANAEPFLNWGQRVSVPVMIALESGSLPDQTHHRFARHDQAGELWLLTVGGESVLVLFDRPQFLLAGQAFAFAFDYPVPASDYTFKGDLTGLDTVVSELVREWQAWSAFSGIAIHGLDEWPTETVTHE